jgi:hypothetical protein
VRVTHGSTEIRLSAHCLQTDWSSAPGFSHSGGSGPDPQHERSRRSHGYGATAPASHMRCWSIALCTACSCNAMASRWEIAALHPTNTVTMTIIKGRAMRVIIYDLNDNFRRCQAVALSKHGRRPTAILSTVSREPIRLTQSVRIKESISMGSGRVRDERTDERGVAPRVVRCLSSRQLLKRPLLTDRLIVSTRLLTLERECAGRTTLRIKKRVMSARSVGVADSLRVDHLMEGKILIGGGLLRCSCRAGDERENC